MKEGGIVYSTNKDFKYQLEEQNHNTNKDFILSVCFEKKGRAGKGVTIIKGFEGNPIELAYLAKEIKKALGIGGSNKNGEIILQGRIQKKIIDFLTNKGFKTKRVGG